ncbi:MAG: hypothetical protein Q9M39_09315 [Sulfurovum sp.]|nr:hypothetical protein [Sulfurovum sp.]
MNVLHADVLDKEGKYFVSWGWNLSDYSKSDISFKGDGYDYTLRDVSASDRQTTLGWVYITEQTIPQYDIRVGYFFTDTDSIVFGVDHMKYVVDSPQVVQISGTDHQGVSHSDGSIQLDGFLKFEHTDGLNYINVAYNKFFPIWQDASRQHALTLFAGAGAGVLIPRSNITLIGYEDRKDDFKLAGYGLDIQGGLHVDLYENFFMRGELKTGYINMPYISTSRNSRDEASQDFFFAQYSFSLGYTF